MEEAPLYGNSIMALKSTQDQARTRLLLTLWTLGTTSEEIKKGDLTRKVVRKGEKTGDYQPFLEELVDKGAIATTAGRPVLITTNPEQIKQLLLVGLQGSDFAFNANVGKNTANALVNLIRGMGQVPEKAASAPVAASNGNGQAQITSYDEFKDVALQVYDTLNRDFNMDNLVPIYRIRREIGDRVSRENFSKWLFEMQSNDSVELLEESVEDSAPEKLQDSVTTKLGKLRCYVKRLA